MPVGDSFSICMRGGPTRSAPNRSNWTRSFRSFPAPSRSSSVALLQQIERGNIALDDLVASYWPEFGQKGKEQVTVRHLLTHRGGFPVTPTELQPASWGDQDAVREAIASMPVDFSPGSATAYHSLTQHWVCAELVRRLDGREIADYLRE